MARAAVEPEENDGRSPGGAGRFARVFIAQTAGYVHDEEGRAPTIEDVADNWTSITDEDGYLVPTDLNTWSAEFMAHLRGRGTAR